MISLATIETQTTGEQYVKSVFEKVKKRNPNEPEFHQAVKEILESLTPVFDKHPNYMEEGILERIVEPERHDHIQSSMGR